VQLSLHIKIKHLQLWRLQRIHQRLLLTNESRLTLHRNVVLGSHQLLFMEEKYFFRVILKPFVVVWKGAFPFLLFNFGLVFRRMFFVFSYYRRQLHKFTAEKTLNVRQFYSLSLLSGIHISYCSGAC
jgi:hypothetical protein